MKLVITTIDSKVRASRLANLLIQQKLAACVSWWPVNSVYIWQGKKNTNQEYILIIKTPNKLEKKLFSVIKKYHSYKVPEIISINVTKSNNDYLDWLNKVLN